MRSITLTITEVDVAETKIGPTARQFVISDGVRLYVMERAYLHYLVDKLIRDLLPEAPPAVVEKGE